MNRSACVESTHDPFALAKTPRQREFVTFLLAIEPMTEAGLAEAVAACPQQVRERLARGPLQYRYDCGVCSAFGDKSFHGGTPNSADPMWRAWAYHEVPKLRMRRSDDLHYGALANETYERAIATYRAAGWDGKSGAPNA